MRLFALSDLHVNHPPNRQAVEALAEHPDDWLLVGGDVCEGTELLRWTLEVLTARFAQVFWVPGNHELWTVPDRVSRKGVALYEAMVSVCRSFGVHTPEDPWIRWPGEGLPTWIAPVFTLYDYSFSAEGRSPEEAVQWAKEGGIRARDEVLLHPDPYPSRQAWCEARCEETERRLAAVPEGHRVVLINHWPLREDLVRLFRIPRYAPWCGTTRTRDWHQRFPIDVVVTGHLHVRATDWRDDTRFEEVSLGTPAHWRREVGAEGYLREILPGPPRPGPGETTTRWWR